MTDMNERILQEKKQAEVYLNQIRGSMAGGAIGDALGYAIEFMSEDSIFSKYGPEGITEYGLTHGVAQISDDTQMTLFTANGLLVGDTIGWMNGVAKNLKQVLLLTESIIVKAVEELCALRRLP